MAAAAARAKRPSVGPTQSSDASIGSRFLLDKEKQDIPSHWSYIRRQLALGLRSSVFQVGMSVFICFTVVFVVVDTNTRAEHKKRPRWMTYCNTAMLAVYFAEITARMFVGRVQFFTKCWDLFDLGVVISDVISLLSEFILGNVDASFSWLRILRIMRVLRLFRVFKHFHELNLLVHGIASALKAILWATVLMSMCILVWSIVAVEIIYPVVEDITAAGGFSQCARCKKAFASVAQAFLTFVQTIVAGDSWGTYAIPVIDESPATFFLFLLVTATIQFGLMNLILAVIVDRAQQARLDDTELQLGALHEKFVDANRSLLKWCKEMDCEEKGYITREDLLNGWQRIDEFRDAMKLCNLTQKDLDVVFEVLDTDQSNTLTYAEFVEQLFALTHADLNTIFIHTLHHINRMVGIHAARLEDVLTGKASKLQNKWSKGSRLGQFDFVCPRLGQEHDQDVSFHGRRAAVEDEGPLSKTGHAIVHGLDTTVVDTTNISGALHHAANPNAHISTVPFFTELRVLSEASWKEASEDFGASMLSLQGEIGQDLDRLKEKIRHQDVELKRLGEDLLVHLQDPPGVLPEPCFRNHGDLLKRLQGMEGTLRESACTILSQFGRQAAIIAEMEALIVHKTGADLESKASTVCL